MRWKTRILAVCIVWVAGLLLAMGISYVGDRYTGEAQLAAPSATPDVVARGAYLAGLGDCAACHSIPGEPPYSGGLRMVTPIGAIYTTNITPDPIHGIGRFSLADFDRALRFGVAGGHTLYPAMPFTSYYNTTPGDVAALYAYFRQGVPAAVVPNRPSEIPFPLSMRWPLTYWRWLFAPKPTPFQPSAGLNAEVARGAYFVEGLGHCGECHTPRAITMQLKATTPKNGSAYLSGAVIENFFAPSLRNGGPGTLGDWGVEELAQFLKGGASSKGIAFGSMRDVIVHSTQYMSDADALAAAKYLKSIRSDHDGEASPFVYDPAVHNALKNGDASKPGSMAYLDSCAACHRPDGMGYDRVFPRLAGNGVVQAENPISLISIILQGSSTPRTGGAPAQFVMPSFAKRLSDQDLADLVNFIRTSWGNHASSTTIGDVARVRKAMRPNE
ncbi:cytochrome c [Bradyrhizobium canariense]|uniref:Cytochrome c, mono-and diheme variants n=1 Tax=Bradyrhizobium canariense TaxID=255045 RepID=A0A1H2AHT1_9BRAD|nr:cytochrome c [Bradyrhizobium canariense]SDT45419.1 Cytochrome c, mono-and diheme variants [Bradyrhizobium canariense]